MDLEHRMEESILISDVCDIVYNHAVEHFSVFILYVTNQVYQEKNYRRILWVHLYIEKCLEADRDLLALDCYLSPPSQCQDNKHIV